MHININYNVDINHNFNLEEYIKIFDTYINKYFKDEIAYKKFNIKLNIIPYEFLYKTSRSPAIYFSIYNIFDGMFVKCSSNSNYYEFEKIVITGMFNDDLKYSKLFWRYNENLFDRECLQEKHIKIKVEELKKFFNYLIRYALPVLSNEYKKDVGKFKSIKWRI